MHVHSKIGLRPSIMVAAFAAIVFAACKPALAMPNFAQAYGIPCSYCHIQIPALNAYGRWVQRTGYAGSESARVGARVADMGRLSRRLSASRRRTRRRGTSGRSRTARRRCLRNSQERMDLSRAAMDLGGESRPAVSTRRGLPTTTSFNGAGHIFAGKLEVPAPSEFSQWLDVCGLTVQLAGGDHRRRARLPTGWQSLGIQVRLSSAARSTQRLPTSPRAPISTVSMHTTRGQDKTLQYKLAFANRSNPLEFGYYGARGSWPLSEARFRPVLQQRILRAARPGQRRSPDSSQPIR